MTAKRRQICVSDLRRQAVLNRSVIIWFMGGNESGCVIQTLAYIIQVFHENKVVAERIHCAR